jgi:hypothetical protein
MNSRTVWVSSAALICAVAGTVASAQPRVLIAAAAQTTSTDCRFLDVRAKLLGTGLVTEVDIHNASTGGTVPTLAMLQSYDVVLAWSNVGWANGAAMGDVLADYVDAGGAVVIAVFANATTPTSTLRITGRWIVGDYEVILGGSGQTQGTLTTLGTVHEPSHSIMTGVASFSGGTQSFRPTVTDLAPGATRVADWSDGRVLIAVGANPKRVDLGFYPPSSDCTASWWSTATDGARILANAVVFAAGGGTPVCYANCDGSTQEPILNVQDFSCFLSRFAAADPYANCDGSTQEPILNVQDFSCFLSKFAAGCR